MVELDRPTWEASFSLITVRCSSPSTPASGAGCGTSSTCPSTSRGLRRYRVIHRWISQQVMEEDTQRAAQCHKFLNQLSGSEEQAPGGHLTPGAGRLPLRTVHTAGDRRFCIAASSCEGQGNHTPALVR